MPFASCLGFSTLPVRHPLHLDEGALILSIRVSGCTKRVQARFATLPESLEQRMISQKTWEDISQKIKEVIEKSPAKDLEKNLRAMMESVFVRLNLVTREEFDVQSQVLTRTREKLTELESKLAELEKARMKDEG
jgi:BMFP domain-containing protein YqiC